MRLQRELEFASLAVGALLVTGALAQGCASGGKSVDVAPNSATPQPVTTTVAPDVERPAPGAAHPLTRCRREQSRPNAIRLHCDDGHPLEVIEFAGAERVEEPTMLLTAFLKKVAGPRVPVRQDGDVVLVGEEDNVRLYAKIVRLPEGLLVAMLCGDGGDHVVPRPWCDATAAGLAEHGLPGGAFRHGETVPTVGGQALQVPEGCEVHRGNRISCPGGGLLWFMNVKEGTQAPKFLKEVVEQHSSEYRVTDEERPCTVMGVGTSCVLLTLVDGEQTKKRKLIGVVRRDGGNVVVSCLTGSTGPLTPEPCGQVMGAR